MDWGPFRPFGDDGEVMQYYALDESILEDLGELRSWCDKASAVAMSRKRKPAKRRSAPECSAQPSK